MSGNRAKKTPKAAIPKATDTDSAKASTLTVNTYAGRSKERAIAELALNPLMSNAGTARTFAKGTLGTVDLTETLIVMREKAEHVKAGDLSEVEATLISQAVALDSIFTEMARRAALNMGEYVTATETYLRLAFKAQSQCRATLETLAEIKNPRAVAFVRQTNIAGGPQQVNNGMQPVSEPCSLAHGNSKIQSVELSGARHELPPDTGTPALARPIDSQLETVAAIERATNEGRKSQERTQ